MGRLPDTFANKKITYRQPYETPGDIRVTTGQINQLFPDATFANQTDKPFEIHRMIPRVVALDANGVAVSIQPAQEFLLSLIRLNIIDLTKNAPMTKAPTIAFALVKGTSELTWEWAEPYYLALSEQLQVSVNVEAFPPLWAGLTTPITALRVYVSFEGFFIVIKSPN